MMSITNCEDLLKFHSQQLRLFPYSKPIPSLQQVSELNHETFYREGFQRFENIASLETAAKFLDQFIQGLDWKQIPHLKPFAGQLQLAKLDKIPVCKPIVETNFQAMHFDMGIPLDAREKQDVYFLIALYFPMDCQQDEAKTRVVGLKKLLAQTSWPERETLESLLIDYVQNYGDGWSEGKDYRAKNTSRLSLFARVLDALKKPYQLTHYRESTTGDWFKQHPEDLEGMRQERAFYAQFGLDLSAEEQHFESRPGSLLIIDNLRAIHGRCGFRKASTFYQFMYGVPDVSTVAMTQLRKDFLDLFAS